MAGYGIIVCCYGLVRYNCVPLWHSLTTPSNGLALSGDGTVLSHIAKVRQSNTMSCSGVVMHSKLYFTKALVKLGMDLCCYVTAKHGNVWRSIVTQWRCASQYGEGNVKYHYALSW